MKSFVCVYLALAMSMVLATVPSAAEDAVSTVSPFDTSVPHGCAKVDMTVTTQAGEVVPEDGIAPQVRLAHGDWHPCQNDANACGAGHSCCEGHCVKGACGD